MTRIKTKIFNTEYKRALIYCRVSSERQVNEGHGLDSQEARCINRARDLNLEVAEIFRDEGVSGGLFERPAIRALISYMDAHPTERFVVIFDDLSRLARGLGVHLQIRSELLLRGAKLDSPNFKFDDTPEGVFIENVLASKAQLDKEQNKRQVIQKMKARLEAGYWTFCPPVALRNIKDPIKGKILQPVQPYAAIYKEAIEKYRDYELHTLDDVRRFVLEKYSEASIKSTLSLNGTKKILEQVLYCGYLIYEDWEVPLQKAKHDGFITYETYLAVQARLHNVAKPRLRKDYNADFPLRNYVLCGRCQKPLTAAWYKNKRKVPYAYYVCKTKGCIRSIPRDNLSKEFLKLLKLTCPIPEAIKGAHIVLEDIWKSKSNGNDDFRKSLQKQITDLEREKEVFMGRIAKTTNFTLVDEYEKVVANAVLKVAELEKKMAVNKYSQEDFTVALGAVLNFLENPIEQWEKPDYRNKRLLLNMYFEDRLTYNPETGFQTPVLPNVLKAIQENSTSKNQLVEMAGVKPASKTHFSNHYSQD